MDHSYEEIRKAALDVLAGRERCELEPTQYERLKRCVAEVFFRREAPRNERGNLLGSDRKDTYLTSRDAEIFLEVFWELFRQGIITLGVDDRNREFPFFRVSGLGRSILQGGDAYFFHDVTTYESVIRSSVPGIDDLTLLYLKEAMQAFKSGCILSASVMLGVATEHTFLRILEVIEKNPQYNSIFRNVFTERSILRKFNKFMAVLEQHEKDLASDVKEDLDTNLAGILAIIRNFRNESEHPSGKIISREQCYILLNLFVPYCKKVYQLIEHFHVQEKEA